MTTENSQKVVKKYNCKLCDYICSKKNDYNKHLMTTKHINTTKYNNNVVENTIKYICECKKIYNHRASLYNHKKKCKGNTITHDTINDETINDEINMKDIILNMVKINQELQEKIMDVCKNVNNTNNTMNNSNNNNTMNNSNNKTFNLQVFLNEQCKDAMNLSDFIESIQLNLTDLENMEKLGYTECMFKNIFGHMDFIDIFTRPLHCSDLKRGIIYIKENGIWEKEDAGHSKLINAIRIVEKKNFNLLKEWSKKYPSFSDSNSPYNDKYVKIFGETMNGDKDNLNKVIRKLAKSCVIDKSKI